MYNAHRAMPPGTQPGNRLAELLEQVRVEFEQQASRSHEHEHHISQQVAEMDHIRSKIYHLDQTHLNMKKQYEEEIARLRHELEQRGGPAQPPHGAPSQQPPPNIGHGPANLFQGIMAGGGQGQALAPPPQEQSGQPGMPGHMHAQGPPGMSQPPGPPHNPFAYPQPQGPGINGYGPPVVQATTSPGPAKQPRIGGSRFGGGGPATPLQSNANTYPGSPGLRRPSPPPNANQNAMFAPDLQYSQSELERIGNGLSELDPDKLPPHLKRTGEDWHAVFNPNPSVPRRLDVELVQNLPHPSVVCCVRFSADGNYVATGCNHSAQIFDVRTGQQVSHLLDHNVTQDGDLYIRSVCFSPDGRYLATGAEDKIIRVWDITSRQILHQFSGHDQDIYSLDFASDGIHIASGSGDRTIRIWDIQQGQCVLSLQIDDGVTTVAISPDNRYVAAGSLDKSVRIWDMAEGSLIERTRGEQGHKDSVYSVAFSPSGRELVSGSLDRTLRMWRLGTDPGSMSAGGNSQYANVRNGDCIRTFEGHKDFVLSVAMTPDNKWILSGSKDRGVQFWDPATGAAHLMLQGHKNSVISVAPSPKLNSGLFATGSGDMKARIWRYKTYGQ